MRGAFQFDEPFQAVGNTGGGGVKVVAHGVRDDAVGRAMKDQQRLVDGRQLAV